LSNCKNSLFLFDFSLFALPNIDCVFDIFFNMNRTQRNQTIKKDLMSIIYWFISFLEKP